MEENKYYINFGYSSGIIVDKKEAQALIKVLAKSEMADMSYDGKLTINHKLPNITVQIITVETYKSAVVKHLLTKDNNNNE